MSRISKCPRCGGNIVEPAYDGDGAYPVGRMCSCGQASAPARTERRHEYNCDCDGCVQDRWPNGWAR